MGAYHVCSVWTGNACYLFLILLYPALPASHPRMKGQPYIHAERPPVTTALTRIYGSVHFTHPVDPHVK